MEVLHLPDQFTCYNGLKIDGLEEFSMLLKRFAYPCRYLDMITRFARPVPQLCMASNLVMDYIYTSWGHLLTDLNQPGCLRLIWKGLRMQYLKKVHLCRIALALLTVPSGQFAAFSRFGKKCYKLCSVFTWGRVCPLGLVIR